MIESESTPPPEEGKESEESSDAEGGSERYGGDQDAEPSESGIERGGDE